MGELPENVRKDAERLTRLARNATDDAETNSYRDERDELLAEYGFTARVRTDDMREILVLHPSEWVEGETIRVERIDETDRAFEIPLTGPGDPDDWESVDEHNTSVANAIERKYGEVHGANATAFADFMSNHYARPVESATSDEIDEFLTEYFPRNAWPSDEQKAVVEQSVTYALDETDGVEQN